MDKRNFVQIHYASKLDGVNTVSTNAFTCDLVEKKVNS